MLTDSDKTRIYVYRYYWNNTEKLQSSWSEWNFGGDVLNVDFNKSEIFMVIKRGSQVCLEKINLSTDTAIADMDADHPVLLDRRVKMQTGGVTTLPYTDTATIYVSQKGEQLTATQAATRITDGEIIYAGIPYTFLYRFSEQVIKQENSPVTIGRLQIKNWNLVYNDSGFFKTLVTPAKRSTSTKVFTGRNLGSLNNIIGTVSIDSGTFQFPVLAKSTDVTIQLESESFLPCVFQSAEWEGFYTLRSRRM